MAETAEECWRLLFYLVDDLREKANDYNSDSSLVSNVTVGQMRVLKAVATLSKEKNGEGLMLKTLAEKVKLTSGAVSIIVDSLVRQNLLERRHSSTDRRAVNICLSEKGEEKTSSYISFFNRQTSEFLASLSESEKTLFMNVLQRFHDKVRN
ncbi:MAG: MarR family transcriptional regulator [Lentisphaeria bacterium]|nr:MarR family transcriptional regulator [Lentisphaeria bacterium]